VTIEGHPTASLAEFDDAENRLPAVRQSCSAELQWTSVLARTYLEKAETDTFTTVPTSRLLVVLVTSGVYRIESRDHNRWQHAVYRPGSAGVTAPGNPSTLRWRSLGDEAMTSLHLYLDTTLFDDTGYGRGNRIQDLPDALVADDVLVGAVGNALGSALRRKDSTLYADSAAQFLATHLALRQPGTRNAGSGRGLGDRTLSEVVAYMHAHLADDVSLEALSAVARLSKHHFLRSFRVSTGTTPHRFLVGLRIQRAAHLLRSTDRSVSWVATQCGYRNNSHFTVAFRGQWGIGPAQYRRQVR
jgi:AraC family transcriptional regulator